MTTMKRRKRDNGELPIPTHLRKSDRIVCLDQYVFICRIFDAIDACEIFVSYVNHSNGFDSGQSPLPPIIGQGVAQLTTNACNQPTFWLLWTPTQATQHYYYPIPLLWVATLFPKRAATQHSYTYK